MSFASLPPNDTDDLGGQGTRVLSPAPAPVIELPHRWDESGNLLPETSPSKCPTCYWNGDPESFWDPKRHTKLTSEDLMWYPIDCASCELFRCILFKRAEMEGKQVIMGSETHVAGPGFHVGTEFDDEFEEHYHAIFVSSESPKSDIVRYNIPRRFISSDGTLNSRSSEWARERISKCASSHDLCKSQTSGSLLPTRLINLQPGWEGPDVRLEHFSSVQPGSSYVALSYCWGNHRPACVTTAETLAQNKRRILWDKLPATFQDAAAFTLSLGIQYLWIDSICIIQEDEEDWQREAGRMNAVYKNSYLTLAALFGSDSTSGLRSISIKKESHLLAELRIAQSVYPLYIRQAHYLDRLDIRNIFDHLEQKTSASRCPLLGRAWAYQERTVSPRVMFFSESEMVFQCLDQCDCECGAVQDWCRGNLLLHTNKTSIFMQTASDSLKMKGRDLVSVDPNSDIQTDDGRAWQIARDWRHLVVLEYSILRVSMPRDRLPALAAIAEQFQRVREGETYLAGLWSRSLLDDILWVCDAEKPSLKKSKAQLGRPFSLPTWSWASLQCSVEILHMGPSVPMAEILEANCSYAGENEFGVLQSSQLILRGRVLECILRWHHHGVDIFCSFHLRNGDTWAERVAGRWTNLRIYMDMDQEGAQRIPERQEIHILEISESTQDDEEDGSPRIDWHFLLLRQDDQDEFVYTRAGKATFRGRRPVEGDDDYKQRQDGFVRAFEALSVLTTCEIR